MDVTAYMDTQKRSVLRKLTQASKPGDGMCKTIKIFSTVYP